MLCGSDPMNPHPSLSLYCLIGSQGKELEDLEPLELTRNNNEGTVGKIYTPIFSIFRQRVANMVFLVLGLVSNERSGNSTIFSRVCFFLK